jgi:RNA polymerase sigma-70 factor, ECF subfamily
MKPDPDLFTSLRPRLFSISYRMLGTRADAEDVLQDAWLRWTTSKTAELRSPEAWLVTVVTRLSIDRLRAAKAEREHYVGSWLPEPIVEDSDQCTPETAAELAGEVSVALMWVLERLAPEERAAFLLRKVFDHDYSEIGALLGKSETAVRQIVHRASERVQQERPLFDVPRDAHRRVLEKFIQAARTGDRAAIKALLDANVELVGDGGGKAAAFSQILRGADRIANLFLATWMRLGRRTEYRMVTINGKAGLLHYVDGALESVVSCATDGERIVGIYSVRNPDKLSGVPAALRVPA